MGIVLSAPLLGIAAPIVITLYWRHSAPLRGKRRLLDYVLLWPILLDHLAQDGADRKSGAFLTTREMLGIVVFAVILIAGMAFLR